jgi:hypothetical protein
MKGGSSSSYRAALSGTGADVGGERDDPAPFHTTLIVAEADPDEGVTLFRVVCPRRGLSPLYELARPSADGNPYALYGKQAAEWCGVPAWNHLTLIVAQITSGSLRQ